MKKEILILTTLMFAGFSLSACPPPAGQVTLIGDGEPANIRVQGKLKP
jgi:hypothetical protein